jgi:hypothetical protein
MALATETYQFFEQMYNAAIEPGPRGISLACAFCTWYTGEDLTPKSIDSDLYDKSTQPMLRRLSTMPRVGSGSEDYDELLRSVENLMRKTLFNKQVEVDDLMRMVQYFRVSAPG